VKLIVNVKFNSAKAWVVPEKKNDLLLKHEQGHFDIAYVSGLEFRRRVQNTNIPFNNIRGEINRIYMNILKEFALLQKQYDDETDHYKNQEGQEKWNKKIDEMILSLYQYW